MSQERGASERGTVGVDRSGVPREAVEAVVKVRLGYVLAPTASPFWEREWSIAAEQIEAALAVLPSHVRAVSTRQDPRLPTARTT